MRNLSMDALRAFAVTAELGSVTAAAEQLGRSQPATSLQIKKLEEMLETELFLRINKQLQLSDSGRHFYSYAERILKLNDEALDQFHKPQLQGQIRLGIPSEFANSLLPGIVGRFAQAYPNVTLETFSDLSRNLRADDQRGKYDLVLALHSQSSSRRKGLIKNDELVWVGSPKHQSEKEAELPLILAQEGCLYRQRALQSLDKIKRRWRLVYSNADLRGIEAAIQAGLGVTVLARSTVPDSLRILKDRETLPALGNVDICLTSASREASEACLRLMEFIRLGLS